MYEKSPTSPVQLFKLTAISVVFMGILSACDAASETKDFVGALDDANDAFADLDNDRVLNGVDNCPLIINRDQLDTDGDGLGDSCDSTNGANLIADSDSDGVLDDTDNCTMISNSDQVDTDLNGIGDACDTALFLDGDSDGVEDSADNCPATPNENQLDTDLDGMGDVCEDTTVVVIDDPENDVVPPETDSDNDGLSDELELQLGLSPTNPDTDSDGVSDGEDKFPNDPTASLDSDDDGVSDDRDQFPDDATETSDLNGDGLGDNANPFQGTVISGTVTDANDTAIANARISLDLIDSSNETNPQVLTTTDALGFFTLIAEESLVPDTFVIVVTANGFLPFAQPLSAGDDEIDATGITLISQTDSFVVIEPRPSVHHLGDNNFSGSANSQFQRTSEGAMLNRSFNISTSQLGQEEIVLNWVAKGIQEENLIVINGGTVALTPDTDVDGSFTEQSITLDVAGVLLEGANTLTIESTATSFLNDIDDFEFVFIGFSELD